MKRTNNKDCCKDFGICLTRYSYGPRTSLYFAFGALLHISFKEIECNTDFNWPHMESNNRVIKKSSKHELL